MEIRSKGQEPQQIATTPAAAVATSRPRRGATTPSVGWGLTSRPYRATTHRFSTAVLWINIAKPIKECILIRLAFLAIYITKVSHLLVRRRQPHIF